MMPELYGKCRELGYCDCGGFHGCIDPESPGAHASVPKLPAAKPVAWDPEDLDEESDQEDQPDDEDEPRSESVSDVVWSNREEANVACRYCRRRGAPCVHHGGQPTNKYTARRSQAKQAEQVGDQPLAELAPRPADLEQKPLATAGHMKLQKCEKCGNVDEPGHLCAPVPQPAPAAEQSEVVSSPPSDHEILIEFGDVRITIRKTVVSVSTKQGLE